MSYRTSNDSKTAPTDESARSVEKHPVNDDKIINDGQDISAKDQALRSTAQSFGIRRSEIMCAQYSHPALLAIAYFAIFCCAYTYGIDGGIRYVFQAQATSNFSQHSLLSTVNVIKSVVAAAAQPTYARLSDIFGRFELVVVSVIFYAMGTVIESQAYDVQRFAGGAVLYQVGYSGIIVMLQITLADLSNLNWRLFASFIPALPFIINTWVSGNISSDLLAHHSWNYGIGIWAFIFPLATVPYMAVLLHMHYRAKLTPEWIQVNNEAEEYRCDHNPYYRAYREDSLRYVGAPFMKRMRVKVWHRIKIFFADILDLFWLLDVIGIIFIICVFGFLLVPLTLAGGGTDKWKEGYIIGPLVVGFVLIPFFIVWEWKLARFPIVPFPLLKDRGVWAALIIGALVNFVWTMPNDYMYTVLVVGMRASNKAANRITSLYSFVSVIVGPLLGLLLVLVRRTKPFIIFGCATWFLATGLLFHFRGANNGIDSEKYLSGVIGALCVMGFGAGFFTYTTQLSIQTCTNHEYMAVMLALYLALYNIGSAVGNSVSGAIWTQLMEKNIASEMAKLGVDTSLANMAYGSPFSFILTHTWGTPARRAVVLAYATVQRKLCIVAICLCVPLLAAALILRNHKLASVQSLDAIESKAVDGEHGQRPENKDVIVVNKNDQDPIVEFILTKIFRKGN